MKKVVAIGGGTGLSTLLRGICDYPLEISAIVTMTDDGASTGRLRRDLKMLPPGDIRKCLAALSCDEPLMSSLFEYRFKKGLGLAGHSLGNLLLTALKDLTGSFETAVEAASNILSINGEVIPATLEDTHLFGEFDDGSVVRGQFALTKYGYKHKLIKIRLDKKTKANPKAVKAIKEADLVLIGPGSLYTSIIPNFLHTEIKKALAKSKAKKVYVCNVSTERGETLGYKLSDHVKKLEEYGVVFESIIVNKGKFACGIGEGAVCPVENDKANGYTIFEADIVDKKNQLFHDSELLGKEIWKIVSKMGKYE